MLCISNADGKEYLGGIYFIASARCSVLRLFVRKALQLAILLVGVSAGAFWLLDAAGGDALAGLNENPNISRETLDRLQQIYGLDRPATARYASWAARALQGDLGDSITLRLPVTKIIAARSAETFKLAAVTLSIALFTSFGLAFACVRWSNPIFDWFVEFCVLVSASLPVIVASLALLAVVASSLRGFEIDSLILPALSLSPPLIAVFLAQSRRGLDAALKMDFVTTARAKGVGETAVILRHAARIALNPIITLTGLSVGSLIGGSIIAESIFGRPGLGSLTVFAVRSRDVPLVMGIVVFVSVAVWTANFAAEVLQIINDPRSADSERA
ncbi:MAG: hypothetical protein C4325_13120 [Blastocatellia bacterium]